MDAKAAPRTEYGKRRKPNAASRARSLGCTFVSTAGLGHRIGPPAKTVLKLFDLHRIGTLLRSIYAGCAIRAEQRIGDIVGKRHRHPGHSPQDRAQVQRCDLRQVATTWTDLVPVAIQDVRPERLQHSGTTVRARAAAHTKDQPMTAGRYRGSDHLPNTATASSKRVADAVRQLGDAHDISQLDHRQITTARVRGVCGSSKRVGCPDQHALVPDGDRRRDRAVTTVCDGHR